MYARGWDYPLHLGVTEAGEGEDGRMKSAIGIGALLMDGLGDTIRWGGGGGGRGAWEGVWGWQGVVAGRCCWYCDLRHGEVGLWPSLRPVSSTCYPPQGVPG